MSDFGQRLQAEWVYTSGEWGTNRTAIGTFSCIDFFLLSRSLSSGATSVTVDHAFGHNTLAPVVLKFVPRAAKLSALFRQRPAALPKTTVVGPRRQTPGTDEAIAWAGDTLHTPSTGSLAEATATLDHAYRLWADAAELQIAAATDTILLKKGQR